MKKLILAFVLGVAAVKVAQALSPKELRAARAATLLTALHNGTATQADKDELLEHIAHLVLIGD